MPSMGRRPAIDPRNKQFRMAPVLAAEPLRRVPDYKLWKFPRRPLDQGETGTCTAHAAVHFIACEPKARYFFLDPFALYREIVLLDEYPDNDHEATLPQVDGHTNLQLGSSGTGAAKALAKRGLISSYLWAGELVDAVLWVLTRGTCLVGTNWYDTMSDPTREGFVKISRGARLIGGHEWLLRGVNVKRGIAWAVNSWGPQWNSRAKLCPPGHFVMDLETLERLLREDGDIVSPIEV